MNRRNFLRGSISVMALAATLKFTTPVASGVGQSPPIGTFTGSTFVGSMGVSIENDHPGDEHRFRYVDVEGDTFIMGPAL